MGSLKQNKSRAVSSVHGKIEEMLLTFPGSSFEGKVETKRLLAAYKGIWKALDNRVKFYVLANHQDERLHDKGSEAYEEAKAEMEDELLFEVVPIMVNWRDEEGKLPQNRIFAQDSFVIQRDNKDRGQILKPSYIENEGDRYVAMMLASQTDLTVEPSEYDFEGGNLLVGDDYAILGADAFQQNLIKHYPDTEREEAKKGLTNKLKELFGVDYLIVPEIEEEVKSPMYKFNVGGGRQALYHLDLYVTLGGRHPKPNTQLIYIAELMPYWNPDNKDDIRGQVKYQDEFNSLKRALDQTVDFFRRYSDGGIGPNFLIVRVPLVFESRPDRPALLRSFNNCQVEYYDGKRTFYLPIYDGHKERIRDRRSIETRVRDLFSSIKSNAVWVNGDFTRLANEAASLHCITKVLKRRTKN